MARALDEILNPDVRDGAPLPSRAELPDSVLYAIAANMGGVGLATTAEQGVLAASHARYLFAFYRWLVEVRGEDRLSNWSRRGAFSISVTVN